MTALDLWLLLMVFAMCAGAYVAGWRSAQAYLSAAQSVGEIAGSAVAQANQFSQQLEQNRILVAQLKDEVSLATKVADAHYGSIETVTREFYEALQQSGLVQQPRRTPRGRQHGEGEGDAAGG